MLLWWFFNKATYICPAFPPVDQPTVRHEGDRLQKESAGLNHMDKISCIVLNYNDASTACGLAEELWG